MKLKDLLEDGEGGAPSAPTTSAGWGVDPTYTPNPPYGNYLPTQEKFPALGKVTTNSLRGYKKPVVLFSKPVKKRIKKLLKKKLIFEDLNLVNFYYSNWKHDRFPKVKVLDYNYHKENEKNKRKDLLGWNINYYKNKKEAIRTIDDIDSFARMISANNKEKYQRIKYFSPEQAKLIRRYNKNYIKMLRLKDGFFWKKTDYKNLEEKHKNNF
jgi:hypothetical protein